MTRPNFLITAFIARYDDRDVCVGGRYVVLDTAETLAWAKHKAAQRNARLGIEPWEEDAAEVLTGDYKVPQTSTPKWVDPEGAWADCPF